MSIFPIKRNNSFIYVIFVIWVFFFCRLLITQVWLIIPYAKLYSFTQEERHYLIDRKYYEFMKICSLAIPLDAEISFETIPAPPLSYSPEYYRKEYYFQKAFYYLYPRKIYRQESSKDREIDYSIVYNYSTHSLTLRYKQRIIGYVVN